MPLYSVNTAVSMFDSTDSSSSANSRTCSPSPSLLILHNPFVCVWRRLCRIIHWVLLLLLAFGQSRHMYTHKTPSIRLWRWMEMLFFSPFFFFESYFF
jgi:hypothetical protein